MSEVRYSVNGKYFKDYSVLISSSDGIGDGLKRKKVNTYDWAEYHGSSPDLSSPKFEAREITLKGFVIGSNWDVMMENFNTILYEFQKSGTQRLLIEPFNMKPRPYEVFMEDSTPLEKILKDGQMVGTFTLKLIEPNPIKKVLYFTGDNLNLAYNIPNETEIFYGNGLKETAKGNVALSNKTLANRVMSGYSYHGRNLALNSKTFLDQNSDWVRNFNLSENLIVGQQYTVTVRVRAIQGAGDYFGIIDVNENNSFPIVKKSDKVFSYTFVATHVTNELVLKRLPLGSARYYQFESFKLEKGAIATEWTPAPEDEKYIVIAGNVEEITNLTTNADVLWDLL